MQLMLAGLDAVHGTLMWIFLYITINPAVQNKMAEEIEAQIGKLQANNILLSFPWEGL